MVLEAKKSEQKEIVNNMVVRGSDGEWSFDLSKCEITSRMERYNDNYQKDAVVSMPYRRACTAFGGEDNLKLAVAEDEAEITVEKGVRIVKWSEGRSIKKKGGKDSFSGQGKAELDQTQLKEVFESLKVLGWAPEVSAPEIKELDIKHEVPVAVKAKMDVAIRAIQKTIAEATKLFSDLKANVPTNKSSDVVIALKEGIKHLNAEISEFKSMIDFGESGRGEPVTYESSLQQLNNAALCMESIFEAIHDGRKMVEAATKK